MAYTIDPAFRKAKTQARKRRRRRLVLRLGGATAVLAALSGVGLWWLGRSDADLDAELAMVPTETVVPDPSVQQARIPLCPLQARPADFVDEFLKQFV